MEFRVSRLMKTCVYWEGASPSYKRKKLLWSGSSQVSPSVSLHLTVYLHPSSHPLLHSNELLSISRRFPEFYKLFQQRIKSKGEEAVETPNL